MFSPSIPNAGIVHLAVAPGVTYCGGTAYFSGTTHFGTTGASATLLSTLGLSITMGTTAQNTLTANSNNYIYIDPVLCVPTSNTTGYPTNAIPIGQATTGPATAAQPNTLVGTQIITALNDQRSWYNLNGALTSGYFDVPYSSCVWGSSGGTVTSNGPAISGSLPVLQLVTTTNTETATLVCKITMPARIAGKTYSITGLELDFGNSTGATASFGTPTLTSQSSPAPGTGESAASATLTASACGTLTVTPPVASDNNTAAVTAGQIYSEGIACGTPYIVASPVSLYFTQAFTGPSSNSYTIYTPGLKVSYSYYPF